MTRRTFNEDLLFKKKANPVAVEKPIKKPLFDANDDEEEDFVFKKERTNTMSNPINKPIEKKPNRLLDSDSEEEIDIFQKNTKKKTSQPVEPKQ